MDDIDKIIGKIKAIKEDIDQGKSYKYLGETYGVEIREASDFKYLTLDDMKTMRESIEYIISERNNGERTRKISAHLGFGNWVASYILKELGYELTTKRNRRTDNPIMELENIWRAYKSEESISNIAAVFGYSSEDIKVIIDGFEKRIEKRRRSYEHKGKIDFGKEREKLKNNLHVSDDVLDYILLGTPINTEKLNLKNKVSVGEDER